VLPAARLALSRTAEAGRVIRDPDLSDDEKEAAVRRAALGLLVSVVSIAARSAGCLLAAVAPVYLLAALGLAGAGATFALLTRWDVILVSSLLIVAGTVWTVKRKLRVPKSDYSAMDRAVHRLAFAAPFVQMTASDIEDSIFGNNITEIPDRPPIFITALPRAGTTVMLNALHDVPGVATHLYRDMPLVMAPLLWSRLSGSFGKEGTLKERAHRDGIQVGYDSPEAFEEVLWRAFWPGKYHDDRIALWSETDLSAEATAYFRRHFRKIVALRCGRKGRYVSKNNGNIARLELIPAMFPDAAIIVPLRDPAEHAASLLRQHENFLDQHGRDPFMKRYMQDIGHLEFGELHRPVAFEGLEALAAGRTPRDPDYWLAYWIAAYRNVEAHRNGLHIVRQDMLGTDSARVMAELCASIGLDAAGTDLTRHFRLVRPSADPTRHDSALLERARALYATLSDNTGAMRAAG
jgi:hypothetical protein